MRNTYLALALLLGNHLLSQEILYQASWDVTEKESYVLESENDLELYDFMDRSKLVDRSTNYHQEESIDDEYFLQRKLTYLSNSFEDAEEKDIFQMWLFNNRTPYENKYKHFADTLYKTYEVKVDS